MFCITINKTLTGDFAFVLMLAPCSPRKRRGYSFWLFSGMYPKRFYNDIDATLFKRHVSAWSIATANQAFRYWSSPKLNLNMKRPWPWHLWAALTPRIKSTKCQLNPLGGILSFPCLLPIICIYITKTYLYNSDPLKPYFYIVKLGFTGVYIIYFSYFCLKT